MGGSVDGAARVVAAMTLTGDDFAGWEPYRPPWYPEHLPNPWVYVNTMSDAQVTNYSQWVASLEPGELRRLVAEYRASLCECGAAPGEACPGEPLPCSRPAP